MNNVKEQIMHANNIDVPVLLIFFARPEILQKVFEQIRIARPSKLFLYQDGPRENHPDDPEKIRKCREIVEDIDWSCEVHKFYQPRNVGCDPSEFIAQKWAFGKVDRCIVLEDDDVPSQSFFPFCKELLERYKDDERINMICGMNHFGVSEGNPYDYLFSLSGAICGWASWKRVVDTWEEHYDFLDDQQALKLLSNIHPKCLRLDKIVRAAFQRRLTGVPYYETIFGVSQLLNSRLNIVPTKNMISNIGLGADAVHCSDPLDVLPKGVRRVFCTKTYEIDFPLKHPKYVVCDMEHVNGVYRILAHGHYFVRRWRGIESRFLKGFKLLRRFFQKNL